MQLRTVGVDKQGIRQGQDLFRKLYQLLAIAVVLGLGLVPRQVAAQLFREVVVIGDSLSDIGNIFEATGSIPSPSTPSPTVRNRYFQGRFSNGPVWVEIMAQGFGQRLAPSLDGGLNYAYGGAEIGADTTDLFEGDIGVVIPSLGTQVQNFLLSQIFDDIDPVTLYVVWGGANDVRDALLTSTDPLTEAKAAVKDLAKAIRDLADADARYFLVPNLPDLGHTPESRALGPQAVARATAISIAFNRDLDAALNAIEADHDVVIARLDTFSRLEEIVANPAAFGFTNVIDACFPGLPEDSGRGTPCTTPEAYLFWDDIHPTAEGHVLLAQFAAATLPSVVASRGPESPEETAERSLPAQDVAVLQVRLGTGPQPGQLSHVTINFTKTTQQADVVRTVRVHLIHDANANGQFDAGEAVLATAQGTWPVSTLQLELTPPFALPPSATAHLVVTLDINSPAQTVAGSKATFVPVRQGYSAHLAWYAVLLPVLGLLGVPRRHGRSHRRSHILAMIIVCCGIMLTSCDSVEEEVKDIVDPEAQSAFTVVMPEQGMMAQGTMAGVVTFPPMPITGARVRLR